MERVNFLRFKSSAQVFQMILLSINVLSIKNKKKIIGSMHTMSIARTIQQQFL